LLFFSLISDVETFVRIRGNFSALPDYFNDLTSLIQEEVLSFQSKEVASVSQKETVSKQAHLVVHKLEKSKRH
jgi:hypothetical protein